MRDKRRRARTTLKYGRVELEALGGYRTPECGARDVRIAYLTVLPGAEPIVLVSHASCCSRGKLSREQSKQILHELENTDLSVPYEYIEALMRQHTKIL